MVLWSGFAPPRLAEYCKGLKSSNCPTEFFFPCIFVVGFFGTTPLLFIFCWLRQSLLLCCQCHPFPGGFSVPPLVQGKALTQHWCWGSLLYDVNTHQEKAYKEGMSGSKVSFRIKEWGGKLFCLIMLLRFGCSYSPVSSSSHCSQSLSFSFEVMKKGRAFSVQKPVAGILLMGLIADGRLSYN